MQNKKIVLIFRNDNAGYSIKKVFRDFYLDNDFDMQYVNVPEYRITFFNMLRNCKYVRKYKKEICHITGDIHYCILALPFSKTILTIHDTVLLDNTRNPFKWLFFYVFWYVLPCLIAKKITCISNTTKKRLLHYLPLLNKKKITVIYNPIGIEYKKYDDIINYNEVKLLQIGTNWNKNLETVIKSIPDRRFKLTIIGKISEKQKTLLVNYNINYINKESVSDDEILNAYKNTNLVMFISKFEGFGMPIIEGQSVGRLILTSNINPMKEIGGEGCLFFDINDYQSINKTLLDYIDKKSFNNIIEKGFDNIKRFSFETIISQYNLIYSAFLK